ncbi:uncharacterized protein TRIADDRAFT_59646 [Trichoplax adhaerens]|uniref:Protein UNC80 C-terminal domain-containing protein n=1 Tax=Trichoplax adhaerens TaxID=10228 RepID=B3S5N7_TRIAD|nr:predicted protein [Trichoplax adhaerens]EDV21933.1 predicted protein [Trichoplax adhaerens]|eukprot:XP_002115570.1 predicted protein [Trichoplax adhaerens]
MKCYLSALANQSKQRRKLMQFMPELIGHPPNSLHCGSFSFLPRKNLSKLNENKIEQLQHIAFLGLKVLITSFHKVLGNHWLLLSKFIQEYFTTEIVLHIYVKTKARIPYLYLKQHKTELFEKKDRNEIMKQQIIEIQQISMQPFFDSAESCLSRLYDEFEKITFTKLVLIDSENIQDDEINSILDTPTSNKLLVRSKSYPLMFNEFASNRDDDEIVHHDRSITQATVFCSKLSINKARINFMIDKHRCRTEDIKKAKSAEEIVTEITCSNESENCNECDNQDLRETIL